MFIAFRLFLIFFCLSDNFYISISNVLLECLFMCVDTFAAVVKMFTYFVHLLCVHCTEVMGILV